MIQSAVTMTGAELKRQREKLGLTQEELAKRLDVKRLSISRWENQASIPRTVELALREIERQEKAA